MGYPWNKPKGGLSDFDNLRWNRLPNWGRWGRHDPDRPDPNRCGHSICVAYSARGDPEGWVEDVPDVPPPPLNFRDAENLDGFIRQLDATHKEHIRKFFYKKQPVRWEWLDESIRALLDMVDANKAAVAEMKRRLGA